MQLGKIQKMSTMLQCKTYILFTLPTIKILKCWVRSGLMIRYWVTGGLMIRYFHSEIIFFRLDWVEINPYGQKHFRETNNCLCKGSTAKTM